MPAVAPSVAMVNPSYLEPGIIMPYVQASGFLELFPNQQPRVAIGTEDLYIYMKQLNIRTQVKAGQAAFNQLPSVDIMMNMISTPTYLLRVRSEWDHHDEAAFARWGVPLPQAFSMGMRQGHFQLARNAALYGFNPQNGEGIVNTAGAVSINLPPDSFGEDTVLTYDNGQMAIFLLSRIAAIKSRTVQLGKGRHFTIIGPQRVLSQFEYTDVVQLTSFQRPGGGSATVAEELRQIMMSNGDTLAWTYDDTLIGKGSGGTDLVIIVMPNIEQPSGGMWDTNEFAKTQPNLPNTTAIYADMAAPREIIVPLPAGAVDNTSEWRISSGWGIRGEAIDLISMLYQ